jgi:preprotein translocase subunit SecA
VTELIFKMEQLNEEFVGSTWVETAADHAEAGRPARSPQQQQAIDGSQGDAKLEPIRNRGEETSAATTPAPAAAARSTRTATCGRTPVV